jgi:hypothetical protein
MNELTTEWVDFELLDDYSVDIRYPGDSATENDAAQRSRWPNEYVHLSGTNLTCPNLME